MVLGQVTRTYARDASLKRRLTICCLGQRSQEVMHRSAPTAVVCVRLTSKWLKDVRASFNSRCTVDKLDLLRMNANPKIPVVAAKTTMAIQAQAGG